MSRRAFLSGFGAAILCAGVSAPALAQQPGRALPPNSPLSKLFGQGRGPSVPPVARFTADGVGEFVFDQSGGQPLILFRGSGEVVALTRSDAARNDRVYKNDVGEPVLRISGLGIGGLTVYTAAKPQGVPAEPVRGAVQPIRIPSIRDAAELGLRMQLVSNRLSSVMRRQIFVDVPDVGPESWALVADVIELSAQFFEKNRDKVRVDPRFAHFARLLVIEGDQPMIKPYYDTIEVTVAPAKGLAGRPSSARIAKDLLASR